MADQGDVTRPSIGPNKDLALTTTGHSPRYPASTTYRGLLLPDSRAVKGGRGYQCGQWTMLRAFASETIHEWE